MAQPRPYRPYRAALWAVYLTTAFGFSGLIIYSTVLWHVREMTVTPGAGELNSPEACASALGRLYDDIHSQLSDEQRGATGSQAWSPLRSRMHAVGVQCGLETGRSDDDRVVAYKHLVHLERLCEAATTQYGQEVAPTDQAAVSALIKVGARSP